MSAAARKAKPAAKPLDVNIAIRAIQKLEATAKCVADAMNEEMEESILAMRSYLISEGLATMLLTLDAMEATIGMEVRLGK